MGKPKKSPLLLDVDKKTGETLCVVGKGGAGKSTISANLGVALSQRGIKTVVVDADIEDANLGLIYGLGFNVPTIQDFLTGRITVEDTILRVRNQVDLVPGNVRLESLSKVTLVMFQDLITQMVQKYKVVLVDAPAGFGIDLFTVASACENMIIVVTPVITSMAYALKLKIVAEKLGNDITGIVVNKVGGPSDIPRKHIEDITGLDVLVEVEEDEEVLRAIAKGELLLFHRPKAPASLSIERLARKISKNLNV